MPSLNLKNLAPCKRALLIILVRPLAPQPRDPAAASTPKYTRGLACSRRSPQAFDQNPAEQALTALFICCENLRCVQADFGPAAYGAFGGGFANLHPQQQYPPPMSGVETQVPGRAQYSQQLPGQQLPGQLPGQQPHSGNMSQRGSAGNLQDYPPTGFTTGTAASGPVLFLRVWGPKGPRESQKAHIASNPASCRPGLAHAQAGARNPRSSPKKGISPAARGSKGLRDPPTAGLLTCGLQSV